MRGYERRLQFDPVHLIRRGLALHDLTSPLFLGDGMLNIHICTHDHCLERMARLATVHHSRESSTSSKQRLCLMVCLLWKVYIISEPQYRSLKVKYKYRYKKSSSLFSSSQVFKSLSPSRIDDDEEHVALPLVVRLLQGPLRRLQLAPLKLQRQVPLRRLQLVPSMLLRQVL
jgi:hypothetical protein